MPESIDRQAATAAALATVHGPDSDQARAAVDNMLMDHGPAATEQALARVTNRAQS